MHITLLTVGCQKEQKLKGLMFWIPFSHMQVSKWKWLYTWYWQGKEHSCKSITTLTWTHCGWANGDQKHWIHQLQCWMHRFNQEIYTNLSLSKLWHQMRKESRMKIEEWKEIYFFKELRKAEVAILTTDKIDFNTEKLLETKRGIL